MTVWKKTKNNNKSDLCEGPILTRMITFAVPIILSGILQLLFNAADIVVVGRFSGNNALAAVGSTTTLVQLLVNILMGLSVGANVMIARSYGAENDSETHRNVHTAIVAAAATGIVMGIVGIVFSKQLLITMNTPNEVLDRAVLYIRIYFSGLIFISVYNTGSAVLRAIGDTKRPLYYLIASGIINVILNLLFVLVFKMDVAGVALATLISQAVSMLLVLGNMIRAKSSIRLCIMKLKIYRESLVGILKIGIPAAIQSALFSVSNIIIQSSVNSFGATVVAGYSASGSIEGFVYMPMNAFHHTVLSFVGQNYGRGNMKRINRIIFTAMCLVTTVGLILGLSVLAFGKQLLGIYTPTHAVIEAGMLKMSVILSTYFLCGLMEESTGSLRGLGYSASPMLISLLGVCGTRILIIETIFRTEQFHNVLTVYLSYPISWFIAFSANFILLIALKKRLDRASPPQVG